MRSFLSINILSVGDIDEAYFLGRYKLKNYSPVAGDSKRIEAGKFSRKVFCVEFGVEGIF